MWHKFSRLGLLAFLVAAAFLAACSQAPLMESDAPRAARLGTQWGEGRESRVTTVEAYRVTPNHPDDVAQVFYNDADAVRASVGNDPDRQLNMLMAQGDVEWSVRDEENRPLPLERARRGAESAFNIAGRKGMRYVLVFENRSEHAYEVVATVDGLDVISGQPGATDNTGYILRPRGTLRIEGFRKSDAEIAAFRFSSADRAYAANTPAGDARNIGVIGAALFKLNIPGSRPAPRSGGAAPQSGQPNAFPADRTPSYAPPPGYRR